MQIDSPVSIVDLFKANSRPRTKLIVQMIPPGISEDEFKELIREYMDGVDYFVYKPGKISRDSYGHLIGLENMNYGFALLNFTNSKRCHGFHRNFHQFQLADSYGIKSKLFVEFALRQELPSVTSETYVRSNNFESYRDLPMFKEYIQTYPFAARLEQLRNESASSAEIDLDKDENIDEAKFETSKQPVASSPVCLTPQSPLHVTFSSLIAQSSAGKSTESVSPLVEYLKDMALNEIGKAKTNVPSKSQKPAKKANKKSKESKNVVTNQPKNPQIKSADTSKQAPKHLKQKVVKGSTVDSQPKPKQLNASSTKKPQVQSNVQPIENAPQIKGVPKILARKAVITTDSNATVAEPVAEIPKKPARIVKREPYIPPVEPIHNEAKSQPGNVSEKREPYIRPGEITSLPSNKTVTNVSNKPSKNTKVFKTNVQLELISEPSDIKPEQIKKPAKQKKKPKAPVGDGVKTDVVPSETTPIVKRIFTSKAKQQLEKEKQQDPK